MSSSSSPEKGKRRYIVSHRKASTHYDEINSEVAQAFLRMLRAGIPPSSLLLMQVVNTGRDKPLSYDSITKAVTRLGNNFSGQTTHVREFLAADEPWPQDMPIQTTDDFASTISYFKENRRLSDLPQRLPPAVREWTEENFNPSAFPQLTLQLSSGSLPKIEVHETEMIIVKQLLRLTVDPPDYFYKSPYDLEPELRWDPKFPENANFRSYIESALFALPSRYGQAKVIRELAEENGREDPVKNMLLGTLFQTLETTWISPTHTLAGISRWNLARFLARTLPFDQMQRKIIAESSA